MQKPERELIEEKFKGVYLHQQSNFDLINQKLEQIHKQTLKTNGRVTAIEEQTKISRFLESKPVFLLLIILGLLLASTILDFSDLLKLF